MIKSKLSRINVEKIILILLIIVIGYKFFEIKYVKPTEKVLVDLYSGYQRSVNEKIIIPAEYQNPDTPVPSYISKDSTISLTHLMDRFIFKGSKIIDKELQSDKEIMDSQIYKHQMIQFFDQKIEKVLDFNYKFNRANLKLLVITNKVILSTSGPKETITEEFYVIHFRKQDGEWKIYWINRDEF